MKIRTPEGRIDVKPDARIAVDMAPQTQPLLHVFEQYANYQLSMKLLAKNGLRPLTYQEALSRSQEIIERLKDKWFWLSSMIASALRTPTTT